MSNHISRIPRPFLSTALAAVALATALTLATPVTPSNAGERLLSGTFVGQSKHVTTGGVSIEKDGDRTFVVLHNDFSLDGAPAPTLGFSNAGTFDKATEFAKLKSLKGKQRYELPRGIVLSAYDAFTVWCSKFSVPLGTAKLG